MNGWTIFMRLADEAPRVHTQGINWEIVGVIVGPVFTAVLVVGGMVARAIRKASARQDRVTEAITGITNKEGVVVQEGVMTQLANLNARVGGVEQSIVAMNAKVRELEGHATAQRAVAQEAALERERTKGEQNEILRRLSHDVGGARMAISLFAEDTNQQRQRFNDWVTATQPEKALNIPRSPVPGLAAIGDD